ncbi:hypothetical protein pipiens_008113 [Culex pipiens pipiens]|uniref:Uncharacterized protein n=1 Tax=Culex pipiens pipiens TaxID=38569 RepID=A0ABD1DIK9_CULPP
MVERPSIQRINSLEDLWQSDLKFFVNLETKPHYAQHPIVGKLAVHGKYPSYADKIPDACLLWEDHIAEVLQDVTYDYEQRQPFYVALDYNFYDRPELFATSQRDPFLKVFRYVHRILVEAGLISLWKQQWREQLRYDIMGQRSKVDMPDRVNLDFNDMKSAWLVVETIRLYSQYAASSGTTCIERARWRKSYFLSLIVLMFFMSNAFETKIVSLMVRKPSIQRINTLEDLSKSDLKFHFDLDNNPHFANHSVIGTMVAHGSNPLVYDTMPGVAMIWYSDFVELRKELAYDYERMQPFYVLLGYSYLQSIELYWTTFRFIFLKPLQFVHMRLVESGLIDRWKRAWRFRLRTEYIGRRRPRLGIETKMDLTFEDMQLAWISLAAGLAASGVVFVVELLNLHQAERLEKLTLLSLIILMFVMSNAFETKCVFLLIDRPPIQRIKTVEDLASSDLKFHFDLEGSPQFANHAVIGHMVVHGSDSYVYETIPGVAMLWYSFMAKLRMDLAYDYERMQPFYVMLDYSYFHGFELYWKDYRFLFRDTFRYIHSILCEAGLMDLWKQRWSDNMRWHFIGARPRADFNEREDLRFEDMKPAWMCLAI